MTQICTRNCQLRIGDQIVFVSRGEATAYDEDHPCLKRLGSIDFSLASRAELMAAEWDLEAAEKAVGEAYGVQLYTSGSKKSIVERILDARRRAVK